MNRTEKSEGGVEPSPRLVDSGKTSDEEALRAGLVNVTKASPVGGEDTHDT